MPTVFVFGGGVLSTEPHYFQNGMPCVIEWVAFEGRSVLSNSSDDFFEGFATGECALCKSPVVFGLTQFGRRIRHFDVNAENLPCFPSGSVLAPDLDQFSSGAVPRLRKGYLLALCIDRLTTPRSVPLRQRSSLALLLHDLSPTAAIVSTETDFTFLGGNRG